MRIARLPKASVAIHVNGNALREYEAESEHPTTATSYVETVNGAEFSVVLKLERGFSFRDKELASTSLSTDCTRLVSSSGEAI